MHAPIDHATDIRRCLEELERGVEGALQRLLAVSYDQLRRQARAVLRGDTDAHQASSIVNDALLPLLSNRRDQPKFEGPAHFFAFTSRVIRNAVTDRIRAQKALKRGGGRAKLPLDPLENDLPASLCAADFGELHDTLERLRLYDERLWTVTELKFFQLMSNKEVAETLGLSVKTVEKDWTFAKAWLQRELADGDSTRTISTGS